MALCLTNQSSSRCVNSKLGRLVSIEKIQIVRFSTEISHWRALWGRDIDEELCKCADVGQSEVSPRPFRTARLRERVEQAIESR